MISQEAASTFSVVVSVALSMLFLPSHSPERILYLRHTVVIPLSANSSIASLICANFNIKKMVDSRAVFFINKLRGEKISVSL